MSLQIGVNSEPPLIEVKKLFPIPEIICSVNEDKDKIRDNIEKNIKLGLPQVQPYETQWDKTVGIVLGGPTLKETFSDLSEKRKNGMSVITGIPFFRFSNKSGKVSFNVGPPNTMPTVLSN